jgi:hypothetical protein
MGKMTDTLQIQGLISGFVRDFVAKDFNFSFKDSTDFKGTIKMRGLPDFFETHMVGNVEKMNFTYQDISEFAVPTATTRIPLPEMLACIKEAVISGEFYGFHNNFNTEFNLHTNVGNIYFDGALNNDMFIVPKPYYFFTMYANKLNVKDILGLKDDLMLTFVSDMSGEGMTKEDADLQIDLDVEKMKLYDDELKDFVISCDMENQRLVAQTDINSNLIKLDVNGMLDVSGKVPSFDVKMNVENADLYRLRLLDLDNKMLLSTKVMANLRGDNIDRMYGEVRLDSTVYCDSRGSYLMDSLDLVMTENHFDSKDVSLICDFFDLDVNGILNFKNIGNTFKNYVRNHYHVNKWGGKGVKLDDEKQDFYVNMNFKNTETLSRLLMPNLMVSDNTNFTATFTSSNYQLYSTLESEQVVYNGLVFNELHLKNKTERNKTTANLKLKNFIIKMVCYKIIFIFYSCTNTIFVFKGTNRDEVEETLILSDVDVREVNLDEDTIEVLVEPTAFGAAKDTLAGMGINEFEVSEITFLANETVSIPEGEDKEKFRQLLDVLDELEDVQNVYHNVNLD